MISALVRWYISFYEKHVGPKLSMKTFNIARDFSRYPSGVKFQDGTHSGEGLRHHLVDLLEKGGSVTVELDGTMGYGSSFLKEAFGGIVDYGWFTPNQLHARLTLQSSDPSLVKEIWSYIDVGEAEKRGWLNETT